MRAEVVSEILDDVIADFTELSVIARLETLAQALQNQINSPTAENQVLVRDLKDEILDQFSKSRFSRYPISLTLTLDEMKIEDYLPLRLAGEIEDAFSGNQITPATVLAELADVQDKARIILGHAKAYKDAAGFFEFEARYPEPDDEFEFTISIPREAVNNELDDFGRELTRLDKLLGVFSEMATGSRSDFKIKSISSSDLTVVLHSVPAVAILIVTSLERLTAAYERMLNIIHLHRQLKESKVPDGMIRDMEKFTQKTLREEIQKASKEIESNLLKKVDAGRRLELRTELKRALEEIISRFDRGYVFDVRGPEPTGADSEGDDAPDQQTNSPAWVRRVVAEKRELLKYFKAEDEPVLGLSGPNDDEATSGNS